MAQPITRLEVMNALRGVSFRADQQLSPEGTTITGATALDTYVPLLDFALLASANTQIIYGRNGTGKTHLLRSFSRYCQEAFTDQKLLVAYIDMRDLALGPVLPSITVEDLISRFYRQFLAKLMQHLATFADTTITVGILGKLFRNEAASRHTTINNSLNSLKAMLEEGLIEERIKEYRRTIRAEQQDTAKLSASVGASSAISTITGASLKVKSDIGVFSEEAHKHTDTLDLVYRGLAVIDYNRIRTELERIIECCGATALVILVDEWSSVDIGMQPLLAEMIQKTLTLSHRIYLKLAALQFFTRTSSSIGAAQPIGLQSGVDIAPLMDLDELLNCDIDPVGVTAFLTQVALKHVGGDLPSVRAWSPETFQEFLCKEIFDSSDTYVQVVRASEGNPRDFLRMLSLCCAFVHNDERISSVVAQRAAIKNFVDVKAPAIEGREGANHLFDLLLFARIVKNRSGKVFLLTRSKCETDQRIRELWHYRFIHLIERSCSVLDMNDAFIEYSLFAMDYGKLMSLKVQRSSEMLLGLVGATDELIGGITGKSIGGLTQFLGSTALGAGLMTATASMIVAREGAETTDVRQIEELVSKCVFDDLLNER